MCGRRRERCAGQAPWEHHWASAQRTLRPPGVAVNLRVICTFARKERPPRRAWTSPGARERPILSGDGDARNLAATPEEIMVRTLLASVALAATLFSGAAAQTHSITPKAEQRIIKGVRHQILMLPYLGVFDYIAFKVDAYDVTLVGQVTRPTLKKDAESAVKRVEGVEHVTNQIEILPVSNFDDQLRARPYRAIYGFGPLNKYALPSQKPIRIIVRNGHVTLEGVVDSEGDRNLVGIRANGVADVFSVRNNLFVSR